MKIIESGITTGYHSAMELLATSLVTRLRLRQLALLIAVADYGSLRRAAAAVHLSQPGVTKMLQEMEAAFGVPLIERHARGVLLSSFGKIVLRYARPLIADMDRLRDEVNAFNAGHEGRVTIGAMTAPGPLFLMRAIAELGQKHNQIRLSVHIEGSSALLPMLEQGTLDVVIGRMVPSPVRTRLNFEPLCDEDIAAVVACNHPLASRRRLKLKDLAPWPWVLPPPRSQMRQRLEHGFSDAGILPPASVVETGSIFAVMMLVEQSEMISVMPSTVARHYEDKGLLHVLPVEIPARLDAIGVITRANTMVSPATRLFIAHLKYCALDWQQRSRHIDEHDIAHRLDRESPKSSCAKRNNP